LGYFKEVEKYQFTLSHFWLKLKDYPKWQDSFKALYKDGKKCLGDLTIGLEEYDVLSKNGRFDRPRGHKAHKTDLWRQALSIAMENTLRMVFTEKEEASAKRDERRCRDKEEKMQTFADIQRNKDLVTGREIWETRLPVGLEMSPAAGRTP
jgi:hypothetical protein